MIPEAQIMQQLGLTPGAALCIGGHKGEEYVDYNLIGFKPIIFVEANPALRNPFPNDPNVRWINAAVAQYNGVAKLRITNDTQCSSLLDLKEHREIYPHIEQVGACEVGCVTLESLITTICCDAIIENKPAVFPRESCSLLHIDCQGMDGAILAAFPSLDMFGMVSAETNEREMYAGCMLYPELAALMDRNGFREVWQDTNPCGGWGGAIYVRKELVK